MQRMKKAGRLLTGFLLICFLGGCGDDITTGVPAKDIPWVTVIEEPEADGKNMAGSDGTETGNSGAASSNRPEETINETDAGTMENDNIVTITISAAGDVTLGNHQEQEYAYSFRQAYDTEGEAYFLKNVKYLFSDDDMTIVNFEGVLTFSEEMQEKDYNMKGDPDYINILTEGSVEAVSFGNNHRLDFKESGSKDTVEAFKTAGLTYAYDNIVGIYETKGICIGFVSVNEVSQGAFVEKYLQEGIDRLKMEETDMIIACCHWGTERDNYPEDYQKELGRKCIDWGADLVLGSHPHVLQGVDVYQGKFIVYSLANFCFGGNRNPQDKDTMIFRQTFTFQDGVKQDTMEAQVIPCSVSSVSTRNDFCPTPAEGEEYTRILGRINEYSAPFGVEFDESGWYISQ